MYYFTLPQPGKLIHELLTCLILPAIHNNFLLYTSRYFTVLPTDFRDKQPCEEGDIDFMLCDLYIYHPAEWYDQQPNSELFGGTMFVLLALESTEHRPGTERNPQKYSKRELGLP